MKKWQACIIAPNSLLILSICKKSENVHFFGNNHHISSKHFFKNGIVL